jgi:hypothetical protein
MFLMNIDFLLQARGYRRQIHGSLILRALVSPLVYGIARAGGAPARVYIAQR